MKPKHNISDTSKAPKPARRQPKKALSERHWAWSGWDLAVLGGLLALSTRDAGGASRALEVAATLTDESQSFGKAFEALGSPLTDARQMGQLAADLHADLTKGLGSGATGADIPAPSSNATLSSVQPEPSGQDTQALPEVVQGRDYGASAESIRTESEEVAAEIRRLFSQELEILAQRQASGDEQLASGSPSYEWLPAIGLAGLGAGGGAAGGAIGGASSGGLSSFFGSVIDGYVSGASVWVDRNRNGVFDDGDLSVLTNASGNYTFTDSSLLKDSSGVAYDIYSSGGVDTSTLASIGTMKSGGGSKYITPISTLYAYTDEATLTKAGLTIADLAYDPQATLDKGTVGDTATSRAALVMQTGQSLLTLLSNTSAILSEVSGTSQVDALKLAFVGIQSELQSSASVADVLKDSTKTSSVLGKVLSNATGDANASSTYAGLIDFASSSIASINTELMTMSAAQIKAGANLSYAAAGQSVLLAEMKSVASGVMAGTVSASDLLTLKSSYDGAALQSVAALQSARLAFNKSDSSGISTASDTVYLDAPKGPSTTWAPIDVLKNDTATGGTLKLAGVGRLDANSLSGALAVAAKIGDSQVALNAGLADGLTYSEFQLTVVNAKGSAQTLKVSAYDPATKKLTLDGALAFNADAGASFLVSRQLPPGLSASIVDGKVQLSGAPQTALGQLDLLYLAVRTDAASAVTGSRAGLLTTYFKPPAPTLPTLSTLEVAEALRLDAKAGASYTEVTLNLNMNALDLGTNGSLELRGLPKGALLQVKNIDQAVADKLLGATALGNWVISGADLLTADLTTLKIQVPGDERGSFSATLNATSRYANLFSTSKVVFGLNINPSVDGLQGDEAAIKDLANLLEDAVPNEINEETPLALQNIKLLVSQLKQNLLADSHEYLAVKIKPPEGWVLKLGDALQTPQADGAYLLKQPAQGVESLEALLKTVMLLPTRDYAGQASVSMQFGSFEPLDRDGKPVINPQPKFLGQAFMASVDVLPVSDIPTITASLDGAWRQLVVNGQYRIEINAAPTSNDRVGVPENVYLEVRRSDLTALQATLDPATITPIPMANGDNSEWIRFTAVTAGKFALLVSESLPTAVARNYSLGIRAVANDPGAATDAWSDPLVVNVPFISLPRVANVQFNEGQSLSEDAPIALDQLVTITPAAGRALSSHELLIKLPVGFVVKDETGVPADTKEGAYTVVSLSGGKALSQWKLWPANNANGLLNLDVVVRDNGDGGLKASSVTNTGSFVIVPVADGVDDDSVPLLQNLQGMLDEAQVIHDPSAKSIFSGFVKKVASESLVVRLVFDSLSADQLTIQVGGEFVAPLQDGSGLIYQFSALDLQKKITLIPRSTEVHGAKARLEASTLDGEDQSAWTTVKHTLELALGAQAPDVSFLGAKGLEDTAVPLPLAVYVDPARASFERIGIQVTVVDASLNGTVVSVKDAAGALRTFKITNKQAVVFSADPQLDFTSMTVLTPNNYAGKAVFTMQPFAQVGTSIRYASAAESVVLVASVAEVPTLQWSNQLADGSTTDGATKNVINGTEDGSVTLRLWNLFDQAKLTDVDEKIALKITLPSAVALLKDGVAIAPVSVDKVSGQSTYLISASETALLRDLTGYSLKPSANYASTTPAGDRIAIEATAFEPDGTASTPSTLSASLVIRPVADLPGSPVVVSSSAVMREGSATGVKLEDLVRVPSVKTVDPSERVYVEICAVSQTGQVSGSDLAKLVFSSGAKVLSPVNGKLIVAAEDLGNLSVAGAAFSKGTVTLSARVYAEDSAAGGWKELVPVRYADTTATVTIALKPVANGVQLNPVLSTASIAEDAGSVSLRSLISQAATTIDADETLVYQIAVPTAVKLIATGSVALPSASAADGALQYLIKADDLSSFALLPVRNFSGNVQLTVTAGSLETDGSVSFSGAKEQTVNMSVTSLADAPLLVSPASVSGIQSVAAPVQALATDVANNLITVAKNLITGDVGEVVTVRISVNLKSGASLSATQRDSLSFTLGEGTTGLKLDADGVLSVSADKVPSLSSLKISSTLDFRGNDALLVSVTAQSKDDKSIAEVTKTSTVTIYQPVAAPEFLLGDTTHAVSGNPAGIEIPFKLTLAADAAVSYSNVSVLFQHVPDNAYFMVKTGNVCQSVGATLGDGGVWLISGSDLQPVNGVAPKLLLISPDDVGSGKVLTAELSAQAFVTDPMSGTSNQSAEAQLAMTLDDTLPAIADPLVLSLDGSALTSLDGNVAFDIDTSKAGTETALSWVRGDATNSTGFAFLVKQSGYDKLQAGGTVTQLTMDDLYVDFADLVARSAAGALTDGKLTGAEIGKAWLWFDNGDGKTAKPEVKALSELHDFTLSLPETVARPADSGSVAPLYEAKAYWGDAKTGSMFAVGIPYRPAASGATSAPVNSGFNSMPTASIVPVGALKVVGDSRRVEVPEDEVGGIGFTLNLSKATASDPAARITHLMKVYGVPDEGVLSAGVKVGSGNSAYWLLSEEQAAGTLRILPFDATGKSIENWLPAHDIALSVSVVASTMVTTTGNKTVAMTVSSAAAFADPIHVLGVPDTPLLLERGEMSTLQPPEGGVLSLGSLAGKLTLAALDPNESLKMRFQLLGADGQSTSGIDSVAGATLANDGWYEFAYSTSASNPFAGVNVTFKRFFAEALTLKLVGRSMQEGSYADADTSSEIPVAFTPVADGVTSFTVSATHASINEGSPIAPAISLQAMALDPKESVYFEVRVRLLPTVDTNGTATVANGALQTLDGAIEQKPVDGWRVFRVDPAYNNGSKVWSAAGLKFLIDPFFDGKIDYSARAISVDPTSGVESAAQIHNASVTVTPLADASMAQVMLLDDAGNQLSELRFDERSGSKFGESEVFRVQARSFDPDESVRLVLDYRTDLFDLKSLGSDRYQLVHKSTTTPDEGTVFLKATVVAQDNEAVSAESLVQLAPINLEKVATKPLLSSMAAKTVHVADGDPVSIALPPAIEDAGAVGEVLVYRVSGVPSWLVPSVGVKLSADTYQISAADFSAAQNTGLGWQSTRVYDTTSREVTLSWRAARIEPSNGDTAESDPFSVTVLLDPVAGTPVITGRSTLPALEDRPLSLDGLLAVSVPGFSAEAVAASVKLNIDIGPNHRLYIGDTLATAVAGSPNTYQILARDIAQASVRAVETNFSGTVTMKIVAFQDIQTAAPRATRDVSIVVANVAEDVSLQTVAPTKILEGQTIALTGGAGKMIDVRGTDPKGEAVTVTLKVSSKLQLLDGSNGGSPVTGTSDGSGLTTYSLKLADIEGSRYSLKAPALSGGSYTVGVTAQSMVQLSGQKGALATSSFTLGVDPVLEAPTVTLPKLALTEDHGGSLLLESTNPNASGRGNVKLVIELIDREGKLVNSDLLALSAANPAAIKSLGGGRWEVNYSGSGLKLPLTVDPKPQFANEDLLGQFDGLTLRVVSTVSYLGVQQSSTATAPVEITAVADGFSFSKPLLTTTEADATSAASVPLTRIYTLPDADERIDSFTITGDANLRIEWLEDGKLQTCVGSATLTDLSSIASVQLSSVPFFNGEIPFTVSARTLDGRSSKETSASLTLSVSAVASEPHVDGGASQLLTVVDADGAAQAYPLVSDDGSGDPMAVHLRFAAFSSPDAKEDLSLVLRGAAILEGSKLKVGEREFVATADGQGGFELVIDCGKGASAAFDAVLLLPPGEVYGLQPLQAVARTHDRTALAESPADSVELNFLSALPPAPATGFAIGTAITSETTNEGVLSVVQLTDLVRIPVGSQNPVQKLELINLSKGAEVRIREANGRLSAPLERMPIVTNDGSSMDAIRISVMQLAAAVVVMSTAQAEGRDALSFSARVGAPDGWVNDQVGDLQRLGYSHLVDFSGRFGHPSEDNDRLTDKGLALDAGGGNDSVLLRTLDGGDVNGGAGRDTLVVGSNALGVVYDGNRGTLASRMEAASGATAGAAVRRVSGFEVVVGTEGDDILTAKDGENMSLRGMGGNDDLIGGSGADALDGGQGADVLFGGGGADVFVLSSGSGTDVVEDFGLEQDRILLAGYGKGAVARFGQMERDADGHWVVRMLGSGTEVANLDLESVDGFNDGNRGDWVVCVNNGTSVDRLVLSGTAQVQDPMLIAGRINTDTAIDLATGDLLDTAFVLDQPVKDIVANAHFREAYFGAFDLGTHSDVKLSYFDAAHKQLAYQSGDGLVQTQTLDDHSYDHYAGLSGSSGDDVLFGLDRSSVLYGGEGGNDVLVGGQSRDILIASLREGSSVDMTGNGGADLFVIVKSLETHTVEGHLDAIAQVTDFNRAEGDRIVMVGYDLQKEQPRIDNVVNNHQAVHFADGLTVVFDLSFVREVDSNFALRMSDFDKLH